MNSLRSAGFLAISASREESLSISSSSAALVGMGLFDTVERLLHDARELFRVELGFHSGLRGACRCGSLLPPGVVENGQVPGVVGPGRRAAMLYVVQARVHRYLGGLTSLAL